jgi:hypothetical protein
LDVEVTARPELVDGLFSTRLKIDRARVHQQSFDAVTIEYFAREPARVVAEGFPFETTGRIIFDEALPPEWSCVVGDCLQNLRQALDHFVWACAARRGGGRARARMGGFRIVRDERRWEKFVRRKQGSVATDLRDWMGEPAWQFMCAVQPHVRAVAPDPDHDPIWALHELSRIDRHETLPLIVAASPDTTWWPTPPPMRGNVTLWDEVGVDVAANIPLFRTPPVRNRPGRPGREYATVPFTLRFDDTLTIMQGVSVRNILVTLCDLFEEHLLPRMAEAFEHTAAGARRTGS